MLINNFLKNSNKIRSSLVDYVLVIGLISITIIIFLTTTLRYLFGMSFSWAEEVCRGIIIWIVFFGADKCLRDGTHVNMDIILVRIPEGKIKYFLIRLIVFICLVFSILLFKWGISLNSSVWVTGQVTPILRIPMYIIYSGMTIGSFLLIIRFLELFLLKMKSNPTIEFKTNTSNE